MKFERYTRYEPLTVTQRRVAAFERKLEKERARYPLFSDHVASEQRTIDAEMTRRQRVIQTTEDRMRSFHAKTWKQSRARFFTLPQDVQAEIRAHWNAWVGPRTSTYFAWTVDRYSGDQDIRVEAAAARQRAHRARLPVDSVRATAPLF